MPPSPTAPIDFQTTAPAVIEYGADDAMHFLGEPDPRTDRITFKVRYIEQDSTGLFKIVIPVQFKDMKTHIIVPICPDAIASLELEPFPTSPDAVQKRLKCSTIRLRFQLSRCLEVVVPTDAMEPLRPRHVATGKVLDALRCITRLTVLNIYVPTTELPIAHAEAVREAVSQRRLLPLTREYDLASLFSGNGGKTTDVSISSENPPSYRDLSPGPPVNPSRSNKRRRVADQKSPSPSDGRIEAIWAELARLRQEKDENTQLRERLHYTEEQVKQLQGQVLQLQEQSKQQQELIRQLQSKGEGIDELCAKADDAVSAVDKFEVDLIELDQRLGCVEEQVPHDGIDSDEEDRIVDTVTSRVLANISTTTYNAKITFEPC